MPHEAPTNEPDDMPYGGSDSPSKPMSEPGDMKPPTGEEDMSPMPKDNIDVGKGSANANETLRELGAGSMYHPPSY